MARQHAISPARAIAVKDLSGPALKAFFRIAELWKLDTREQQILLGSPAPSTFFKWKKEQQGNLARVLHGDGDVPLMLHTVAGDPARTDLAALTDVGTQQSGVLVVDRLPLLGAEDALARLDRLVRSGTPFRRR